MVWMSESDGYIQVRTQCAFVQAVFRPCESNYSEFCSRVSWPCRRKVEDRSANRIVAHLLLVYHSSFIVWPFFDPSWLLQVADCILMHHDGILLNSSLQTHAPNPLITYSSSRHRSGIPRDHLGFQRKKMRPFCSHHHGDTLEHLVFINPQPHLELWLGTV